MFSAKTTNNCRVSCLVLDPNPLAVYENMALKLNNFIFYKLCFISLEISTFVFKSFYVQSHYVT